MATVVHQRTDTCSLTVR